MTTMTTTETYLDVLGSDVCDIISSYVQDIELLTKVQKVNEEIRKNKEHIHWRRILHHPDYVNISVYGVEFRFPKEIFENLLSEIVYLVPPIFNFPYNQILICACTIQYVSFSPVRDSVHVKSHSIDRNYCTLSHIIAILTILT